MNIEISSIFALNRHDESFTRVYDNVGTITVFISIEMVSFAI